MRAPHYRFARSSVVDRDAYLVSLCRGKSVVHLGCADWPYTKEGCVTGALLHKKLMPVCASLIGIDRSSDGLDCMREYGIDSLYCADAGDVWDLCNKQLWTPELVLAGEIIEHLDNPGEFLRRLAKDMPDNVTAVITVPNAFSVKSLLHQALGYEKVHPDHVAYYSGRVLTALLTRNELAVKKIHWYRTPGFDRLDRLLNLVLAPLLWRRQGFAEGIIAHCVKTTP